MKIRTVIVDDEPLAREGIANYVKEFDCLTLIACCENPVQLMKVLNEEPIDLIFLDIQTPKMNGIEFLKVTTHRPMVVLITAFSNYAIEGFELDVLDYLLKPVTFDRFFKSVNKAKNYFKLTTKSTQTIINKEEKDTDWVFIKCGNRYEKIQLSEIFYAEGLENYVTIYTQKDKYVTLLNLKTLEGNLCRDSFIRVHKSYIVSISKIESIEGNEIFIKSHRIPISRNYKTLVMLQVLANKIWVR